MTPTHFVRADGNEANSGTSRSSAWKTIAKATAALWNTPAIVQVGPGYFVGMETPSGSAGRYNVPITWAAEYPVLDYPCRPDLWTVIEGSLRAGPANNGVLPGAPWQSVTLSGVPVWRWAGVGLAPRYSLGYGVTREATPQRITYWKRDTLQLATPEGWAQLVTTNRTQRHGYYHSAAGDLYLYAPWIADPNALWWTAATGAGFAFSTPDSRVTGMLIRGFDIGVQPGAYAERFAIDGNRIETCNHGVKVFRSYPSLYPKDIRIHHNQFTNTGLWSDDQAAAPSAAWIMAKGQIKQADGTRYPTTRISHPLEGMGIYVTACSRADIAFNTIEGYCNGVGSAPHPSFDAGASCDVDVRDNLIRRIMDDAIEPEQQAKRWRIYRNVIEDASTFMSNGPTHHGPIHVWGNRARIGLRGLARDLDGIVEGAAGVVFKYSRQSNPQAHVYVSGNVFTGDDGEIPVAGGAPYAGGTGLPEFFHLEGNVVRVSHDAWGYLPGQFEERGNQFVTSDPTRGFKDWQSQALYTSVLAYQQATGQGQGSCPVDLHDTVGCSALLDRDLRPTPEAQRLLPGVTCPGALGSVAMGAP